MEPSLSNTPTTTKPSHTDTYSVKLDQTAKMRFPPNPRSPHPQEYKNPSGVMFRERHQKMLQNTYPRSRPKEAIPRHLPKAPAPRITMPATSDPQTMSPSPVLPMTATFMAQRLWLSGYISGSLSRNSTISWTQTTEAFNYRFSQKFSSDQILKILDSPGSTGAPDSIKNCGSRPNLGDIPQTRNIDAEEFDILDARDKLQHLSSETEEHRQQTAKEAEDHRTVTEKKWILRYLMSQDPTASEETPDFWKRAIEAYQARFGVAHSHCAIMDKFIVTEHLLGTDFSPHSTDDVRGDQTPTSSQSENYTKAERTNNTRTAPEVNWLIAHGPSGPQWTGGGWLDITRDFNRQFNDTRLPSSLHKKWIQVIKPQKQSSDTHTVFQPDPKCPPQQLTETQSVHQTSSEVDYGGTGYSANQIKWLLATVPKMSNTNGVNDWNNVSKAFTKKFKVVRTTQSLKSKWYKTLRATNVV